MIGPNTPSANRYRFRAWNKRENQMWNEGKPWDFEEMCGWEDWPRDCTFEDLVLMQSTGLLDKNGKEIFCGDVIMQTYDFDESTLEYKLKDNLYVVDFGMYEKKFHCCINDSDDCTCMNDTTFGILLKTPNARPFPLVFGHDVEYEVISNIYENPELLK